MSGDVKGGSYSFVWITIICFLTPIRHDNDYLVTFPISCI